MDKIKVIIADDSDFVRDGMKIILDVDDEFEVIGCAANGKEAIELAERQAPDVFLMDIQTPYNVRSVLMYHHIFLAGTFPMCPVTQIVRFYASAAR